MGRRGKAPQAPGLKVLRGPTVGKPKPPARRRADPPTMPTDFNEAEREAWQDTIAALEAHPGLLSRADAGVLELVARQRPIFREAAQFVRAHGGTATVRDDKGVIRFVQVVPQAQLVIKVGASLKALYESLGLTPAARARLALPEDTGTESELLSFINGGRA